MNWIDIKRQSNKRLNLVKKLIKRYPPHEQKAVIQYMQSNGSYKPYKAIEKLTKRIYTKYHHKDAYTDIAMRSAHKLIK
jgi:N-methylhydantoinase B/oxoprolinase/acetone carboxylase alpha subunit